MWDGLNITHEHDGSGTVTRRYTHGHTPIHGVFSLIDVEDSSNNHFFYHLDQVGGVHSLTDASETTDTTYEFSPFGRMLEETTGSATNDFTFPATYVALPDVTPLRLSASRVYDTGSGRFLSRDPVLPVRRYHYAQDNPLRAVDPSGRTNIWHVARDEPDIWDQPAQRGERMAEQWRAERQRWSAHQFFWVPDPYNKPWDFYNCWRRGLLPREVRFDADSAWTQALMSHAVVKSVRGRLKQRMGTLCDRAVGARGADITGTKWVNWGAYKHFTRLFRWYEYMLGGFSLRVVLTKPEVHRSSQFVGHRKVVGLATFTITSEMSKKSYYAIWGAFCPGIGVQGMRDDIANKSTPGPMRTVKMHFHWDELLEVECCPEREQEQIRERRRRGKGGSYWDLLRRKWDASGMDV